MAIDFSKIRNSSPEEQEAERRKFYEEYERRVTATIAERSAKISALNAISSLSEWERKFLKSLQSLATTYSPTGILGGRIADLSQKQLDYLDRLYSTYIAKR